jgi:hypothetical protein
MLRKPGFWVGFVVVACICTIFGVANFPRAFPVVNLEVEMDREGALVAARELASRLGLGPDNYRQAASFDLDQSVQSFVELEGGGKEAFSAMLSEGLYWPYRWLVRHYAEFETNETLIRFSPRGQPIGFVETIPEDQEGPALDVAMARRIAERSAIRDWNIAIDEFRLVEEAEEAQINKRVDHTFVYEREAPTIGEEGRHRLRLVVSGDRFTELTHYVKIPESFSRRYEEMRSANNGIATGASIAAAIFYVIGGCVIGLFMLLRNRWVLWKQPLKWGLFVASLQALVVLNQWPLTWMGYDTAVSVSTFSMQVVVQALVTFIGMGALLTVSFMAAESLTRKAFPEQLQFWRLWSAEVAGSKPVAGMTIAGFLLVAVFFAYDVALYLFANATLGWWNPSFALFEPDVLATYMPWLSPIAISLQAGFWEECLFRAIPIASAALLGARFGGRRWWILGALILQAVIFGAAHANYPAQPAYARLVELILPAIGFGLLYIVFGLLPAIVLHYAFDVVWFALPLFAASTPGIWFDRAVVVLLALVPLWVVFNGRRRTGLWGDPPEQARNRSWQLPPQTERAEPAARPQRSVGLASSVQTSWIALGVVGLVAWLAAGEFSGNVPRLNTGRDGAVESAAGELARRQITVPDEWLEMASVAGRPGLADRFVWREGGRGAYDGLMETYLSPPRWLVRYASFEGDVVDRAEEYRVWVGPAGEVLRFAHPLPEARDGAALDEEVARSYAETAVQQLFALDTSRLREVSAEPERQPNRVDWKFVFADDTAYPMDEGEARVAIHIAGDEVVDGYRFVHVPEDWERAERNRGSTVWLIRVLCMVVMVVVFIAGLVLAVVRWSRGRFAVRTFWRFAALLTLLGVVGLANSWPVIVSQFSTAQPFALQLTLVFAGGILALVAMSTAVALSVGLVHRWVPAQPPRLGFFETSSGIGLGFAIVGFAAVASRIPEALDPRWPSVEPAGTLVPVVATALDPISGWISGTVFVLLIFAIVDAVSRGWSQRRVPAVGALVVAGFVIAGADGLETIPRWGVEGALTGAVIAALYITVFRRHMALLPAAAAAMSAAMVMGDGLSMAYPGALAGSAIAAILLLVLGVYWMVLMTRDSASGGSGD